jgi:hypothetical protein
VAHERDLVDVNRPRGHELLHQLAEGAPVLRDVAAAVVANVDRRAADLAGQAVAEALAPAERPRELRGHQPVDENHDARRRLGEGLPQRVRLEHDRLAAHPDRHRLAERVALGLEGVAAQAGDGGDQRAPARRGGERRRVPCRHGRCRRHADRPRAEAEPRVHPARDGLMDRAHEHRARPDSLEHAAGDRPLDRAEPAGRLA